MERMRVKSLGEGRIGGYLVVWGGPGRRDLAGEYFTPQTELGLDWYDRRPVLYHHGLDGALKAEPVGVIDTLRRDDVGVWAEAQLAAHNRYIGAIMELVRKGVLGWSSGSLPHLVEVEADGKIVRWPIVEGSLTPTPAQPRLTEVSALRSACKALGIEEDFWEVHGMDVDRVNEQAKSSDAARPVRRLPLGGDLRVVRGGKYADLSAPDMALMHTLLRGAPGSRWNPGDAFFRELVDKARKAIRTGELDGAALRSLPIKADELNYSTLTGFGDEWVPDVWASALWTRTRADNVIAPLFTMIEMPSNPYELPIEGSDPTVYLVPETTDESQLTLGAGNPIPDSKIGTGKVQLSAKKLGLRVGFSGEMAEDSVIPVISAWRSQAIRAMQEAIDHVILNGDVTNAATGNINSDDAGPTGNEPYLAFDGLRHLPLVENTANANDAGGAINLGLMRDTRFLMPLQYALRVNDLAWIVDAFTYADLLGQEQLVTVDKYGPNATVITGEIGRVDGVRVLASPQMGLTEADGKISSTPANNTQGQAVLVYRPGWIVGFRRRVAAEVVRIPYYDAYQLVVTVRIALARFDDEVAAVLYNITV